jgi:hypothetical protein
VAYSAHPMAYSARPAGCLCWASLAIWVPRF